jgi:hypothetical protein
MDGLIDGFIDSWFALPQWTEQDVQLATNELIAQITASEALHGSSEQRQALVNLLELFQQHHPSETCQSGAAEALTQLEKLWPSGEREWQRERERWRGWGVEVGRGGGECGLEGCGGQWLCPIVLLLVWGLAASDSC